MKKEYFAYLSLITAISSGIIYVLSHDTLLSMSLLWPFHILAMAAFGSMIFHKLKANKKIRNSESDSFLAINNEASSNILKVSRYMEIEEMEAEEKRSTLK